MSEIRQNDVGTKIRLEVIENDAVVDISTATGMQIVFLRPDNTKVTKTATLATDGKDGLMQYTTIAGDMEQAGFWQAQGSLTIGTWSGKTAPVSFEVQPNL